MGRVASRASLRHFPVETLPANATCSMAASARMMLSPEFLCRQTGRWNGRGADMRPHREPADTQRNHDDVRPTGGTTTLIPSIGDSPGAKVTSGVFASGPPAALPQHGMHPVGERSSSRGLCLTSWGRQLVQRGDDPSHSLLMDVLGIPWWRGLFGQGAGHLWICRRK